MNNYNDPAGAVGAQLGYWLSSLFNKDKAKAYKQATENPTAPIVNNNGLKTEQSAIFNTFLPAIKEATIKKGGALTDAELKNIIGKDNWKWWRDDNYDDIYNEWYKTNGPSLLSADAQTNSLQTEAQQSTFSIKAFNDLINQLNLAPQDITLQQMELGALNELGLTSDYQAILDAQNEVVNQQYAAELEELARAENDMYRAVGLSQRQMERDIAKRRQQALKSGMSTAQLAAQEQQNILAAQMGATQIAQDYANQRYGVSNQFAGANAQNYANVLAQQQQYAQGIQQFNNNLMNQQTQFNAQQNANWANTLASIYGQNYASDSYVKQLETTK